MCVSRNFSISSGLLNLPAYSFRGLLFGVLCSWGTGFLLGLLNLLAYSFRGLLLRRFVFLGYWFSFILRLSFLGDPSEVCGKTLILVCVHLRCRFTWKP